jgi:hypothetical protein
MGIELLFQHFNTHPFLLTLLILASMSFIAIWLKFIAVWFRGWPMKSEEEDEDENNFLDNEEKNYTLSFQQIKINLNSHGLPESVEGVITIKEEEN